MRMRLEHRHQNLIDDFAAGVQRAELDAAVEGNDFERRPGRGEFPARVAARVFITRRKIEPAVGVQIAQQVTQTLAKTGAGLGPADTDTARSRIV